MLPVITIVAPIFAVILSGWLARRVGVLGPQSARELSGFVVNLALPALLFDIVANAHWSEIWQPGFIAAFGISMGAIFGLAVLIRSRKQPVADAVIDGLCAAFPNTGYIGFPLAVAAFGNSGLPLAMVATLLTTCVLFSIAIMLIETSLHTETHPARLVPKVAVLLATNPLLIAPVLGAAVAGSGLQMPEWIATFVKMLAMTASPCALVALGLSLARDVTPHAAPVRAVSILAMLKLIVQPALTWFLATRVFALPATTTQMAVLMAALPTGTGPFMAAEFYDRSASTSSRVILLTTLISIFTIASYLLLTG